MNIVKKTLAILGMLCLITALVSLGNMPVSLLCFPVNVALLLLLIGITHVLYEEKKHTQAVRWWMSTPTSVGLMALIFVCSLVIALVPQIQFQQSWFFIFVLMLVLAQLQMVILRYKGAFRKRFYLTHIGLYLFVAGLAFGAPDTHKWRAVISEGQTIDMAYNHDGHLRPMGFSLTLNKFEISYYNNHVPRLFRAEVSSGKEHSEISVNHPWARTWKQDIYLVSHGMDEGSHKPYCVLEIIDQPWKYIVHLGVILTAMGAFLLLLGKHKHIKTL